MSELTSNIHFILSLLILLCLFLVQKIDWSKTQTRFVIKKIIDCIITIIPYSYIAFSHYMLNTGKFTTSNIITTIVASIVMVIAAITSFVFQVFCFSKLKKLVNKTSFIFILISLFVKFLVSFATINYIIYVFYPSIYHIPEGLSIVEVAFEFIYYTFLLMITYSGNTIQAIGIGAKLLQVFEILVFYVMIGIQFTTLITKVNEA